MSFMNISQAIDLIKEYDDTGDKKRAVEISIRIGGLDNAAK